MPLHNRFAHELQRHYLIADDFGGPAKGKVNGLGGYERPNFMVPRLGQLG